MEEKLRQHEIKDDKRFAMFHSVIFGNPEIGELGMKEKVDVMYEILTSLKTLLSFLEGFSKVLKWFVGIGIAFALFKAWASGLITYLLNK